MGAPTAHPFFVDVTQGRSLGHIFGLLKTKVNGFPEKCTTLFGPLKHRHFLDALSCGFVECFLRFCYLKVRMLRGPDFTCSLLGKTIHLQSIWQRGSSFGTLQDALLMLGAPGGGGGAGVLLEGLGEGGLLRVA